MSPFVPLLIAALGLVTWSGFQLYQLRQDITTLTQAHANQESGMEKAKRMRQTLDALATQTKRLSDAGNPNARLVIDEMAKRGITVNVPAPGASAPN